MAKACAYPHCVFPGTQHRAQHLLGGSSVLQNMTAPNMTATRYGDKALQSLASISSQDSSPLTLYFYTSNSEQCSSGLIVLRTYLAFLDIISSAHISGPETHTVPLRKLEKGPLPASGVQAGFHAPLIPWPGAIFH